MKLVTWNQARTSQHKVFREEPQTLVRDAADLDIVVIAC